MSTPQKIVSQMDDEEMKTLLTSQTPQPQTEDDDNKLVTSSDLVSEPEVEQEEKPASSLWSDPDRLKQLATEMQALTKVRIVREKYSEAVLLKAMAEVLTSVGWYDYTQFTNTIRRILTGPRNSVPFSVKTRNQRTGKMDFWLIRAFINVDTPENKNYSVDGKDYNKRDVLMSKQFCDFLRDYCRTQLKDEVQFWAFTGTYKGKQQLDMSKLAPSDISALESIGETNPDHLVMFQFKKKTPEVMVGKATSD
jgi:hypothetical protein